jgi:hypothetical protein
MERFFSIQYSDTHAQYPGSLKYYHLNTTYCFFASFCFSLLTCFFAVYV